MAVASNRYRDFDASKLTMGSLRRVILMYGSDRDGIRRRMDAMSDLLTRNGRVPDVFASSWDACQRISSGGLFDPVPTVIITDASDAFGSSKASAKRLTEFLRSVRESDEDAIVIADIGEAPTKTALGRAEKTVEKVGGVIREVSVTEYDANRWLAGIASRSEVVLKASDVSKVRRALSPDMEHMEAAVRSLGNEIPTMSERDIRVAMGLPPTRSGMQFYTLRRMLVSRDSQGLMEFYDSLSGNGVDSMFLSKLMSNVSDALAMLASGHGRNGNDGLDDYVAYKGRHYAGYSSDGDAQDLETLRKSGGFPRWERMYMALSRAKDRTYGYDDALGRGFDAKALIRELCM